MGRVRALPQHFIKWAKEVANSDTVNTTNFQEGLCRLTYVAGALEHERPYLSCTPPSGSSEESSGLREVLPAVPLRTSVAPRVDAQASEDRTGIGGCAPELDEEGRSDPLRSRWCSREITRANQTLLFERGSTIEALAVLLSLKLFFGDDARSTR